MFLFPDRALQMCSFFFYSEEQKYFAEDAKHRTLESIHIGSMEKP